MDEVLWGPRKHFLLFKSRLAVYHAYFTVPYDFNACSAEPREERGYIIDEQRGERGHMNEQKGERGYMNRKGREGREGRVGKEGI